MSKEYDAIVKDAASRLEIVLRQAACHQRVYVVVWPTNATENGRVEVRADDHSISIPDRIVAPRNSHTGSWNHVPYSNLYAMLWDALRSEPIMPIHPIAA
jgi:hypothetical protein